jgi:hypothetical protein
MRFSFFMALLLSTQCVFMDAADRVISTDEHLFDLALHHDPSLDHTCVCALALVNKNLSNCVAKTKDVRKEFLMHFVEQYIDKTFFDYISSKFSRTVYFHRYGSLCVYLTKENVRGSSNHDFYGGCDLCCNWAYCKDGLISPIFGKKPLMDINFGVTINVGAVWGTNIPYFCSGLTCYGTGHGIQGPFFAQDGTGFSFFYRPDYFRDKKGEQITFTLDGTEKREPCKDVEACIAAYQPKTKQ